MKKKSATKKMKIFDCQQMPPLVKKAFFTFINEINTPHKNDCYVDWHTKMWTEEANSKDPADAMSKRDRKLFKTVNKWLISNGMKPNEDVLISHSW